MYSQFTCAVARPKPFDRRFITLNYDVGVYSRIANGTEVNTSTYNFIFTGS